MKSLKILLLDHCSSRMPSVPVFLQFRAHGSMRTLLKAPTVVDEYFRTETDMWHALKSVPFSTHVRQCVRKGVSLSLTDWLRYVTLIPFSLSMSQLIRVFDEEDTVTALTSVCAPPAAQQPAHTITASNHQTCSNEVQAIGPGPALQALRHWQCHWTELIAVRLLQISKIRYNAAWDLPILLLVAPMHPQSRLRVRWDTFILLVLFTVCIITPYMICFDVQVGRMTTFGAQHRLTWYLMTTDMCEGLLG